MRDHFHFYQQQSHELESEITHFNDFFGKIQHRISTVTSLEELVTYRKRVNICTKGLPFKTEQGRLVSHYYTAVKRNK